MANDTHRFRCPCCHKKLEFDSSNGSVREVDTKAEAAEQGAEEMDRLLDQHKHETDRLDDAFTRATQDTLHQADGFDDLFEKALDEAKDDDEKPPNPFDLD